MNLNYCFVGDCRDSMRLMLEKGYAGKVQTIVTSPPYWGLRDYGVAGQIGHEPTLQEFIATLVEVFDLCRELLADDGTLWLNMGDSYASRGGLTPQSGELFKGRTRQRETICLSNRNAGVDGLKNKDLCGQPWRLAFALQDAGWYLRQDIIWHKPNPMPESVRDRCTKAHEYLFLLTKSERYYFNQEAISEPIAAASVSRLSQNIVAQAGSARAVGKTNGTMKAVSRSSGNKARKTGAERGCPENTGSNVCGSVPWEGTKRNKRSVWTVTTEQFSEAHFAVMPTALVEPCILAGSRAGDIVFDPFLGSGTVAQVAQNLGRHWLGCELNPEYIKLQQKRTRQQGLMLEVSA
jgi:DNA modification methylase